MAVGQRGVTHKLLDRFNRKILKYKSVSKEDLVRGRCVCRRCGTIVRTFYYIIDNTTGEHYALCTGCALELNPPKWKLIISTTSSPLDNHIEPIGNYDIWDSTNKRRESVSLAELVQCGWFIRKVKETIQIVPKRTTKKIDLEYYGKLACARFKNHYEKLGLVNMTECDSPFCKFVYENMSKPVHKLRYSWLR